MNFDLEGEAILLMPCAKVQYRHYFRLLKVQPQLTVITNCRNPMGHHGVLRKLVPSHKYTLLGPSTSTKIH